MPTARGPSPRYTRLFTASIVAVAVARLRAQLSSFKAAKRFFFFAFDELPRTPSNKIRKPLLSEMIAAKMPGEDAASANAASSLS